MDNVIAVSREQFLQLSTGVRIEYVEQGADDGAPVIFLHGVTDSWRSFQGVLPFLAPPIHAFAISLRGHGGSSRPLSGYRFSDMSEDLLAFMDAAGLPTATIVGHSMGSGVAQRFVIDHPDRVTSLVLVGAFAKFYQDPGLTDFYTASIAPLVDPISPAFAREWQLSTLAQQMDRDHLDTVVAETLKVPAHVWRQAFEGFLMTPDFTDELRRVSVPTLLMWGDRDTYALRESQDRLMEVLPGARLIVYESHGHALHWEAPERFARDVLTFVVSAR